jgi:hypothetical protein
MMPQLLTGTAVFKHNKHLINPGSNCNICAHKQVKWLKSSYALAISHPTHLLFGQQKNGMALLVSASSTLGYGEP